MSYRTKPNLLPISELNDRGMYDQVKSFTTLTKATSPYYTLPPEGQPARWHIWFDGRAIISLLSEGLGKLKKWSEGPTISVQDFTTGTGLRDAALGLLAGSQGKKIKGLGIVIHLADLISAAPVKESFDNLDKFDAAATMAVNDPKQILLGATESTENSRFRAVPVAGGKKNKIFLFKLSRSDLQGTSTVLEVDAPISITVRCAQIEALAACQWLVEGIDGGGGAEGNVATIIVLYYRKATLLVLYDENHAPSVIRHLPHADGKIARDMATEFAQLIKQAPMGTKDIAVTVFDFGEGGEEINAALSGKQIAGSSSNIVIQVMPASEMTKLVESMGVPLGLPEHVAFPAECLLEYKSILMGGKLGGGKKNIAALLRAAEDNYLDASIDVRDSKVSSTDMTVLLLSKLIRVLAIIVLIGSGAFMGLKTFGILNSEYWKSPEDAFIASSTTLQGLEKETKAAQHLNKILAPRLALWQNMELVMALFPEGRDLQLTELRFSEDASDRSMKWNISGYANEIGLSTLRSLQTPQVLADAFEKVAKRLGVNVFLPGPGKTRKISVREDSNSSYSPNKTDATSAEKFSLKFSLDLTYSVADDREPVKKP